MYTNELDILNHTHLLMIDYVARLEVKVSHLNKRVKDLNDYARVLENDVTYLEKQNKTFWTVLERILNRRKVK
jgi:hypothetical protein